MSSRASRLFTRAKRVLLFDHSVYSEIKVDTSAIEDGVLLILIVGLLVGTAQGLGLYLKFVTMPSMQDIARMVKEGPWFPASMPSNIKEYIEGQIEAGFEIAEMFVTPTPLRALGEVISQPISMLLGWLLWGALAHFSARLLKGTGSFGATLSCLAYSIAPHVVRAADFLPGFSGPSGLLATIWGFACFTAGLKYAQGLSTGRAVLASILPALILLSITVLLASALISIFFGIAALLIGLIVPVAVILTVYLARR